MTDIFSLDNDPPEYAPRLVARAVSEDDLEDDPTEDAPTEEFLQPAPPGEPREPFAMLALTRADEKSDFDGHHRYPDPIRIDFCASGAVRFFFDDFVDAEGAGEEITVFGHRKGITALSGVTVLEEEYEHDRELWRVQTRPTADDAVQTVENITAALVDRASGVEPDDGVTETSPGKGARGPREEHRGGDE